MTVIRITTLIGLLFLVGCIHTPTDCRLDSYEEFVQSLLSGEYMGTTHSSLEETKVRWRALSVVMSEYGDRLLRDFPDLMSNSEPIDITDRIFGAATFSVENNEQEGPEKSSPIIVTRGHIAFMYYSALTGQRQDVAWMNVGPEQLAQEAFLAADWIEQHGQDLYFDSERGFVTAPAGRSD